MAEIAPDDSPPLDPDEGPFELLVPISLRVEVECKVITDSAGDSVDVTIACVLSVRRELQICSEIWAEP